MLILAPSLPMLAMSGGATVVIPYGHTIGGPLEDYVDAVQTDAQGNVYLAGSTLLSGSVYAAHLAKFSRNGTLIWDRQFAQISNSRSIDLAVSPLGEAYLAGECMEEGLFLSKLSTDGSLIWTKLMSNFSSNEAWVDIDHSTGGVVMTIGYSNYGPTMALDADGTVRWTVWTPWYLDEPRGIVNDLAGNTYVLIHHWDTNDIGIVKLNSHGNIVAQRILDTPSVEEWALDIGMASDGGIVLVGDAMYADLMVVAKVSNGLDAEWLEYVRISGGYFSSYGICASPSGTIYVVAGTTSAREPFCHSLLQFSSNGSLIDASKWATQAIGWAGPSHLASLPGGEVVAAGNVVGVPEQELEELAGVSVDGIPTIMWADSSDHWTKTNEASWDLAVSCVDSGLVVDVFDEAFGTQGWYGIVGAISVIDVQISHAVFSLGETLVDFNTSVTGGTAPFTYRWSFGDGSFAYGSPTSHQYAKPGIYYVQVFVQDSGTDSGSNSSIIRVLGPPEILNITFVPVPGYMPVMEGIPISFTVVAHDPDGGGLNYSWDWDDGTWDNATSQVQAHRWSLRGDYTVNVTVTDDEGNSTTAHLNITIALNVPPWATFGFYPSHPRPGTEIQFSCYSGDVDDTVESWVWDFGDGSDGWGWFAYHTYSSEGVYNVSLTVTDSGGKQGVAWTLVPVVTNWSPEVDFSWYPTPSTNQSITFDGHQSSDPDGTIVRWDWSWGDGSSDPDSWQYAHHVFLCGGYYNITLTVTDDGGMSSNLTRRMYVNYQPVANITFSQESPIPGELIELNASASHDPDDRISRYIWVIGNTTMSLLDPVTQYVFFVGGDYWVNLTVIDESGGIGSATRLLHVDLPPVAIAGSDVSVPTKTTLVLNGSLSHDDNGIVTYAWRIECLNLTLVGRICGHNFTVPGVYTVTLTVTDTRGQSESDQMVVTVYDIRPPTAVAGQDIVTSVGAPVAFDGSESSDDGVIVNYTWRFTYEETTVTLYGQHAEFTFIIPGTYNVTLTVVDSMNNTCNDSLTIEVEEVAVPEFSTSLILIVFVCGVFVGGILVARKKRYG